MASLTLARARRHKVKRGTPKPFCKTCGINRVKTHGNDYCSPQCVPKAVRSAAGRKGRKNFAFRRRTQCFSADLDRLGQRPTREDMLAVMNTVYKRAYNTGFQAALSVRERKEHPGIALAQAEERGAA